MHQAVRRLQHSNAPLGSTTGPVDVHALVAAFGSDDGMVRKGARELLVAIEKPAVRGLMEALRDPREHVRWEAAKALGEIHDKTSAAALVTAMEDKSFGIRWLAAEGLVAIGQYSLPPLLRALVKRSDSIWLRQGALHILHQMAAQDVCDEMGPVVSALEGPAPSLRTPQAAWDAIEKRRGARRLHGSPKRARQPGPLCVAAREVRAQSRPISATVIVKSEIRAFSKS